MNRPNAILPACIAAGILGLSGQAVVAQTTVFSDTFGGSSSTQVSPITPTATATTYEYFTQGVNPTTPTLASGDMHLVGRTTSITTSEIQALFTSTPVTLSTAGQYLNLTIVFTDNQNMFPSGSPSTLDIGLYNSGGVAPNIGARLDTGTYATGGGTQLWKGYIARIGGTGGATSAIITRPAQGVVTGGTTSQNQDLLFNGASGTASFNDPTGSSVASTGGQLASGLTSGNAYTLSYTITLSAANTLTISDDLYSGTTANPLNLLISQSGSTSSSPITSYDGLAFGWRLNNGSSLANAADINSITVSDNLAPVPEPSVFALAGLAVAGLAMRYRRARRSVVS
ncbi:MAG TPA: PEP-CTERM sorting domain-containing protein [Candidatus Angelobacter sp.]|nr:PEP-CTERM sorting domain-containing protein [Candidatus Angelobacter sp.]